MKNTTMINTAIHWSLDPEITDILGFSLRYYGVLFVAGLILCILFLKKIFAREGIDPLQLDRLTIYGVLGIFLGARLAHCLFYDPAYFFSHPLEILLPVEVTPEGNYVFTGYRGLASHGGALGMIIAILVYVKITSEPLLKTLDMIAIVGPLSGVFIRLANLANSEIIGKPSDMPWAFVFTRVDMVARHPAQLYEAIIYLVAFGVLWHLYNSEKIKPGNGLYFGLSILMVFMSRFLVEFVKERQVTFEEEMLLDLGQWLSVPFIVVGILFIVFAIRNNRKMNLR